MLWTFGFTLCSQSRISAFLLIEDVVSFFYSHTHSAKVLTSFELKLHRSSLPFHMPLCSGCRELWPILPCYFLLNGRDVRLCYWRSWSRFGLWPRPHRVVNPDGIIVFMDFHHIYQLVCWLFYIIYASAVCFYDVISSRYIELSDWWRAGWDSNPRCREASPVFKTGSLNHSDTYPI